MSLTPHQADKLCDDYAVKVANALIRATDGCYGQISIEDVDCRADLESEHLMASGIIRFQAINARDMVAFADTLSQFANKLRTNHVVR